MKKYILLFTAVAALLVTSCTVQEGTEPGNDIYPHVVMTLSQPSLPYDLDSDTAVRVTANDATTDVYYFVEKTETKKARNLIPEAYADYVIANGQKLSMTTSSFDGSQVCDFVAQGLGGDNTLTAVAVSGGVKHMASKTFFGIKWNTIATGSYTFAKDAIAQRAGGTTIPATLQQRDDQPGTYRFKDLFGPTYSLVFTILDGYVGEDDGGVYRYIRVEPQAIGLTYGTYGGISVRDLGYWQGDDAYVTDYGYEGGIYDDNSAFLMVQYYVSAGSLGYGYDLFELD